MTPDFAYSLSPDAVAAEGCGEGEALRPSAALQKIAALPPHPTVNQAWRRGFALLWILLLPLFAHAQIATATPGDDLDVALITFGPGEEVWERFGHNAILVRDGSAGTERLYNYGMFDFAQENFYLNFARGRMLYRISVSDPAEDYPIYRTEGRWIVEQDLHLAPAQRANLRDFLDWNARPENAQYSYEYFRANCSTRVRDALNDAVGGAIRDQLIAPSRGFTYRMDTLRLMRPELALMLGMDAGLGPFADQRLSFWDESFVPMEFMRHMRDIRVHDAGGQLVPLVARETQLAAARVPEPLDFPPQWFWRAFAAGVMAALILLGLSRLRARAWARAAFAMLAGPIALACGLGGIVLVVLWTLTDHVSAWRNENLLLLNPLCLLLLPAWFGTLRRNWQPSRFAQRVAVTIATLAGLAFFVKVFPAFVQDNRMWIALLLPVHAALAASLYWRAR
jgi:hypothetical protein